MSLDAGKAGWLKIHVKTRPARLPRGAATGGRSGLSASLMWPSSRVHRRPMRSRTCNRGRQAGKRHSWPPEQLVPAWCRCQGSGLANTRKASSSVRHFQGKHDYSAASSEQ